MIDERSQDDLPEEGLYPKGEIGEKLEMPVKKIEQNGRYHLFFSSIKAAEDFVLAFWSQVDNIRGTSTKKWFEEGMWKPSGELTYGCRTEIVNVSDEDKKEGAACMLYINGNVGRLQEYGVKALQNLGAIKI